MRGSDEFVATLKRHLGFWVFAPKGDERVSGNNPHGFG
jgi:hypothetical protein